MDCAQKKCGGYLRFVGYASMGGSHSNYYQCSECEAAYEIYDRDIDNPKEYMLLKLKKKKKSN